MLDEKGTLLEYGSIGYSFSRNLNKNTKFRIKATVLDEKLNIAAEGYSDYFEIDERKYLDTNLWGYVYKKGQYVNLNFGVWTGAKWCNQKVKIDWGDGVSEVRDMFNLNVNINDKIKKCNLTTAHQYQSSGVYNIKKIINGKIVSKGKIKIN